MTVLAVTLALLGAASSRSRLGAAPGCLGGARVRQGAARAARLPGPAAGVAGRPVPGHLRLRAARQRPARRPIAVVQPIVVSGIVWAVPARAALKPADAVADGAARGGDHGLRARGLPGRPPTPPPAPTPVWAWARSSSSWSVSLSRRGERARPPGCATTRGARPSSSAWSEASCSGWSRGCVKLPFRSSTPAALHGMLTAWPTYAIR